MEQDAIWLPNARVLDVHAHCLPQLAGMAGTFIGYAGSEVKAYCKLLDMPRSEWSYIARGVKTIAGVIIKHQQAKKEKL